MQTKLNRQALRSQSAREQIVSAALTVFALKGYAAASMDDICLAAGCSKGGLYHHFRTKSAVLANVIDRLGDSGALTAPFQPAESVPGLNADCVGRVLIDIWAECAREPELCNRLGAASSGAADRAGTLPALQQILEIGGLVQRLSRSDEVGAEEAARRLGVGRAA